MSETVTRVPAIEGWFTLDADDPRLLGNHCRACGTYAFPPREGACPNPDCDASSLDVVALSSEGAIWSYCENHFAPPAPFVAPEPFTPYAIAAVEMPAEGLVVMGQVASGVRAADLAVGMAMRLTLETLFTENGTEHIVWKWRPAK